LTISRLVDRGVRRIEVWSDEGAGPRAGVAEQIGRLLAAMSDIERLDVSGCKLPLTGNSLARAIRPKRLVALKHLNLTNQRPMTGEWLKVVAELCPNLDVLNLTACLNDNSDNEWPIALCRFPRLRWLSLSACSAVNTETIRRMMTSSAPPSLESLSLMACVNLTDEAASCIVDGMPRLRSLTLALCPMLTDDVAQSLSKASLEELFMFAIPPVVANVPGMFRTLSKGGVLMTHAKKLALFGYMNDDAVRLLASVAAG
jgi:hypothetical protein